MNAPARKIVLGTRGSALALAQAEMTEAALRTAHPDLRVERKIIKTTGDRRTDVPLAAVATAEGHLAKGVFIKELEVALEEGVIDVAVHSLKDMPSALEPAFVLAAILPRAPSGDVLVSKSPGGLAGLTKGATVATSSVRRQRMLQDLRPDLQIVDIRGNVPTRLRKLHEREDLSGIVLAQAGLLRLGLLEQDGVRSEGRPAFAEVLDPEHFLPAAGQGAVALEARAATNSQDEALARLIGAVDDGETRAAVQAERKFLELLGAGCDTPVGVSSRIDREHLSLRAVVFEEGESAPLVGESKGLRTEPNEVAKSLVASLVRRK